MVFAESNIKAGQSLPFKEEGESEKAGNNGSYDNPLADGIEVDAEKNKDTNTKGETKLTVRVVDNLKTDKKEFYPYSSR